MKALLEHPIGRERAPSSRNFQIIINSVRSKQRVHRDPLAAIAIMIKNDPRPFF